MKLPLPWMRSARAEAAVAPAAAPLPVDPIEGITDPVLIAEGGRVTRANAAARTLLGGHIVGEGLRVVLRHPAAAEALADPGFGGAVDLAGLGGQGRRFEMRVAPLGDGARVIHMLDRTAARAAERARTDFVANASHELRTPLSAILGFVETLEDEAAGGDAEVRKRFLGVMHAEARRMQRLIDDLISLSRIESEKYELPDTTVALAGVIAEAAGEMRDAGGATPVIELALDTDAPPVTGERAQLSQLVHNLVGNALKYGRPPVRVALTAEGDRVRLTVVDAGDGIPAEHIPRLTERFYRVDAGRSRALGGTGLGLAICKHIVERHRGRMEIASVSGQGTTVTVTLPAAAVIKESPN